MNLFREVSRSNWTGEEVQSDKAECPCTFATVRPYEATLIEAYVGLKRQVHRGAGCSIGSDAAAANPHVPHESAEIGDLGRLIDYGQRQTYSGREMVDEDPERGEWAGASGYRFGPLAFTEVAQFARLQRV
jgi:hypothetical protein